MSHCFANVKQDYDVQNYGYCLLAPNMLQIQAELWPTKTP